MGRTVYACSDGTYYGDVQVWERFESGAWQPCCWDDDSGTEWVVTSDGDLLTLTPVSHEDLPDRTNVERVAAGVVVTGERDVSDRTRSSSVRPFAH